MAKNKNEMLKRQQKKKAENKNKRAKVGPAQTPPDKKKTLATTQDLITGFTADVINLAQHKAGMKMILEKKLKFAEELVEKNPLKFNEIRVDVFREIRKDFDQIDKGVNELMVFIGKLSDLPTFEEKMMALTSNFDKLSECMFNFEAIGRKLQDVDQKFNASVQHAMGMDVAQKQQISYIETYGEEDFQLKLPTLLKGEVGEIVDMPGEILGDGSMESTLAMTINIVHNSVKLFRRNPETQDLTEVTEPSLSVTGNIGVLNYQLKHFSVQIPEVAGNIIIAGFNKEGATMNVVPIEHAEPSDVQPLDTPKVYVKGEEATPGGLD